MPETPIVVRECASDIPDPVVFRGHTLFNCLTSGLTVFCLKIQSLAEFDELVCENEISARIRNRNAFSVPKIRYSGLADIL